MLLCCVSAWSAKTEREYWLGQMLKMCTPVLESLAADQLKARMPVEVYQGHRRDEVTHLEALARSFAGLSPWLGLPADATREGRLRARWQRLAVRAISNATNPACRDHLKQTRSIIGIGSNN